MDIEKGIQKITRTLKLWRKWIIIGWGLVFLSILVFIGGNEDISSTIFSLAFLLNMWSSIRIAMMQLLIGSMLKSYKKIFSIVLIGLLGMFTFGIFAFIMANKINDRDTMNRLSRNWDNHIFERMFFIGV